MVEKKEYENDPAYKATAALLLIAEQAIEAAIDAHTNVVKQIAKLRKEKSFQYPCLGESHFRAGNTAKFLGDAMNAISLEHMALKRLYHFPYAGGGKGGIAIDDADNRLVETNGNPYADYMDDDGK